MIALVGGTLLGRTQQRSATVWPGMCGHNTLLVGQLGDWTWQAVAESCGVDVLHAVSPAGWPAYLSFCYVRLRGDAGCHPRTPTFGDQLQLASRVYGAGAESVLTVHRLTVAPEPQAGIAELADEQFVRPAAGTLLVENYNRWVSRDGGGSNAGLQRSSPSGFSTAGLPAVPESVSPRLACQLARDRLSFRDRPAGLLPLGGPVGLRYRLDPSRDFNGVGLLYFAAYFGIVDQALLALWRAEERCDQDFMARIVLDQQLCYLANADVGGELAVTARRWPVPGQPDRSTVDVLLRDAADRRLLAVGTVELAGGAEPAAGAFR